MVLNHNIGNFHLYYEPIYIGKGKNDRISDMGNRDDNLIECINNLKSTNDFCRSKLIDNLTEIEAYYIEQVMINHFCGIDNGTGILYNKTYGNNTTLKKVNNHKLNFEFQKITIILDALNNSNTIENASKKINMNLRTLYREIKKYNIIKDSLTNSWIIGKK